MNTITQTFITSIYSIFLCGCVAPRAYDEPQMSCDLYTKRWTLEVDTTLNNCGRSNNPGACLWNIGVPIVSTIISGSIVIIGNTVHWIEMEGRCNQKQIDEKVHEMQLLMEEEDIEHSLRSQDIYIIKKDE